MNISSKLKKIMSFLLVTVLVMSVVVLPVSADTTKQVTYPAGTYPDNSYHPEYEYFGNCPVYTSDELVYTGEKSTDLMASFNLVQQYDMSFCKNSGFYMSRPFEYRSRWDYGQPAFINFGSADSAYNQMFTKTKFDSLTTDFVTENNIDMDTYDIYYLVYQDYSPTREYGYLYMDYICVPKNSRIAISNENKPDGSKDSSEIHYGLVLPASYKSVFYVESYIDGETKTVKNTPTHFAGTDFWNFLGMGRHSTIATNIPIFTLKADADMYVTTGKPLNDPSNKIPEETKKDEKIGADAFYWDSLKCKLARDGEYYKVMFDYEYSVPDMVSNPSDYVMYVDVTQDYKYKAKSNSNVLNGQSKVTSTSCLIGASPGHTVCDAALFYAKAYGGALSEFCVFGATAVSDLLGRGYDWVDINFYNSYITVYVELVHVTDGGNGLFIKDKVSSDIRSFTFDALTLKSLDDTSDIDSSENEVDVKTKDTIDSSGNVTDRTVTGSTVINNITNTVNNYYYDSDGNKKESSGSSIGDSLSEIASGLIKFIKTLVTEGLPAALEILKSLIKTISDLLGFIGDQIGDIGQGTQNGIIAVLKAIPVPLWGICSVALIVFVIVGVLKHIF
jgi:hypothetical protein